MTVSRAFTKELFTLIIKILQITNLKTVKNRLPTGSFNKIMVTLIKIDFCTLIVVYHILDMR